MIVGSLRRAASSLAIVAVVAAGPASAARAGTVHVDAASGDDARDGATWASAVASLDRALALAGAKPAEIPITIRVADGLYQASDLRIARPVVLVGAHAPGGGSRDRAAFTSVLDGGTARTVLEVEAGAAGTILDGFVLRGSTDGALIAEGRVHVRNVRVEDAGGIGAILRGGGSVEESRVVRSGGAGLVVSAPLPCESSAIRVRHVLVEDCGGTGMAVSDRGCGFQGTPSVVVEHVQVRRSVGIGLSLDCCGAVSDVAVVDTEGDGMTLSHGLWEPPPAVPPSPVLDSVTVTGSTGAAIRVGRIDGATLRRSILWGNVGGDLDPSDAATDARHVLSETLLPGVGNMSGVDPLFVDGPGGSTYLSQVASGQAADSPALDAGGASAADLAVGLRTTRTDGQRDEGPVDLGFHHDATTFTLSRGTAPDALSPRVSGPGLPLVDAGAVGAAPVHHYRVDADRTILLRRDAADVVVLFEHQRFDRP